MQRFESLDAIDTDDGMYVLYSAAQARIAELEAEVARLRGERDKWRNECLDANQSELKLMNQRDKAETYADALAYALYDVDVIGEHSCCNNPWEQALILLESGNRHG